MAQRQLSETEAIQHELNANRRVHPGTKSVDMAAGPPLVSLHEVGYSGQNQRFSRELSSCRGGSRLVMVS
jgi:hypothetical protein